MIEQAKFIYSALGKTLEKQRKTIEYQGIKQAEGLKSLSEENRELESIERPFPRDMGTNENKNGIDEIRKWEKKLNKKS